MADRTVSVRLRMLVTEYTAGARQARQETASLATELTALGKRSPQDIAEISNAIGGVGLALVGVAGYAVMAAATFDRQMSEVGAVASGTARDMEMLRAAALEAGKSTQYSATEAAKAEAELAKAGMATADILAGGLSGALSLAAAGQMDLAAAATITAKAMNMFELPATSAAHVADVFAAAANKTAADMHGLGMGLQQVGLVANQVGWSLEETTAILGAFADRGLDGSDGATSLKTAIMALSAPTEKAAGTMQELGIQVYDAQGQFKGSSALAGELQRALSGLSQSERQAAMATIFGSDAIRAANVLYALGESGVRDYTASVYDQGAAAEMARKKTDNLIGDFERLKGTIETLAIDSGSGASGGLRTLTQAVDGLLQEFLALPGPIQSTVTMVAGVSGAVLLAGAGFMRARQTAAEMLTALRDAGPAGTKAADGLSKAGDAAGKFAMAAGLVLLGYEASKLYLEYLASRTAPVARDVDRMTDAISRWAETGKITGELAKAFGDDMGKLRKQVADLDEAARKLPKGLSESGDALGELGRGISDQGRQVSGLNDEIEKASRQASENFKSVDGAMANLVKNGNINQARIAYDDLASRWTAAGLPLEKLNELLPEYNKAAGNASLTTGGLARGFANAEQQSRMLATSWQDAIDKGQKLTDVFNALNGGALGFASAEVQVENANRSLHDALVASNGSLDVHTKEGAAAKQALLDMARTTAEATQAKYEETGSLDMANAVYQQYRTQLVNTLAQITGNKAEAEALASTYMRMPRDIVTNVSAPGLGYTLESANSLDWRLRNMLRRVNIEVNIAQRTTSFGGSAHTGVGYSAGERWGGAIEHAATGALKDPAVYRTGTRPLYAFAEPETGGEAFIPRFGDLARSRAIVDHVASRWLGGTVSWGGQGGGGSVVIAPTVQVYAGIGADAAAISTRAKSAIVDVIDAYNRSNVRR